MKYYELKISFREGLIGIDKIALWLEKVKGEFDEKDNEKR
jgi:hypothetical protein